MIDVNRINSNLLHFLIAFLSFGYPLTASILVLLGAESSTQLNIILRTIYLFISIYLISVNFLEILKINKYTKLILFFWAIYSLRLLLDMSLHNLTFKSDFYMFSFAYGNGLIPMIAIIVSRSYFDIEKASKFIYYTVLASCFFIVMSIINKPDILDLIYSKRISIGTDENENILNPILISFCGSLLFISSFYKLKNKINFFSLLPLFLGSLCVLMGASRGPSFILIFVSILFFMKTKKNKFLVYLPLIFFIFYFFMNTELHLINRIIETSQNYEEEGRIFFWREAVNQFASSPIFGDRFLLRSNNHYPHNLILEVLMSTGILGFFFFLFPYVYSLKLCLNNLDKNLIYPCVISVFLLGFFSGSLITSVPFWIMFATSLVMNKYE